MLGKIYFTKMKFAICEIGEVVYKFPTTIGTYKELEYERLGILKALKDPEFSKYMPDYDLARFYIAAKYFDPITIEHSAIQRLVESLFHKHKYWPNKKLRLMLGDDLEGRFSKYLKWNNLHLSIWLNNIEIPSSSSHSDLHVGNILVNNVGHPVIIDWGGYTAESSRFFDLINLSITKSNLSWSVSILALLSKPPLMFNIPITYEMLIGYALWKIDNEIKVLTRYGRLNIAKVRKYVCLLDELTLIDKER